MRYIPQGWDDTIQPLPPKALPPIGDAVQEETMKEDVRKFQDWYHNFAKRVLDSYMDFEVFFIHFFYNVIRRNANEPELSEDLFLNVVARCSQDWA